MITYKRCLEVEKTLIFQGFSVGFSDYMVKMNMTEKDFFKRFFGAEGNSLESSFIALDEGKAIGVILGGIKIFEGIKTIRCGALAVAPSYRGMKISEDLLRLHREDAIKNNCKQMFLEVIVGNNRAIAFYEKFGYEKIYDLSYFSSENINMLHTDKDNKDINIEEIDIVALRKFDDYIKDIHINWQNHMDYLEKLDNQKSFGAFRNGQLVGVISGNITGKINFIYVRHEFRHCGVGLYLFNKIISNLGIQKISVAFSNNASLEGFFKHLGFKRDNISQYEMYLTI